MIAKRRVSILDAKEQKRIDSEIRRLSDEFGGEAARSGVVGLTSASLVILAIGGVVMFLFWPTGPSETAVGRVNGISLRETDSGTRFLARVTVGSAQGLVPLPRGAMCLPGDRIDLVKRKTLFSARYTFGVKGCMR